MVNLCSASETNRRSSGGNTQSSHVSKDTKENYNNGIQHKNSTHAQNSRIDCDDAASAIPNITKPELYSWNHSGKDKNIVLVNTFQWQ